LREVRGQSPEQQRGALYEFLSHERGPVIDDAARAQYRYGDSHAEHHGSCAHYRCTFVFPAAHRHQRALRVAGLHLDRGQLNGDV
jgi:hypothetical protein